MISVYQHLTNNNLTNRDYDTIKRYIKIIQWGRKNPVQFIERILGITLMDYQKWLISQSWAREYVCWTCSRNIGKTFLLGCFMMARSLLFPKLQTQIISENWVVANDTFNKMRDIAQNNIKTIVTTNTVFEDELYKSKSNSDGFTTDFKQGSRCELLNGSKINCIAGSSRAARGRRSNVNIYDESGFINSDTFSITEPYATQESNFKLSSSFDAAIYPIEIPNIRLYVGSASDTASVFYQKYKEGLKKMLVGDEKYFVADLNCEIPIQYCTVNGHKVAPLLSQSEVDRKMRENEIIARREYYNIFDNFNMEDCVVSRSDIFSNTENFIPVLHWGGKKHKYIIAYDPASKRDNAPILVMDVGTRDDKQIYGRCVHMENLIITYGDGSKRPMRLDEQVQRLRELLWEYNGRENTAPYEHVTLLIDGGMGGQASAITQELAKDWIDSQGKIHPGIYDEENEFCLRWIESYPHAVKGCLKIVEPRKYRNAMFEAAKVLVPQGYIKFPPLCPKYDVLVLDDGSERKLSKAEQASLLQMDLMKEEVVSVVRFKSPGTGNITYQLPVEKRNKMHDDRNYVFVMACWEIKNLRENSEFGEGVVMDYSCFFKKDTAVDNNNLANDPWSSQFNHSLGLKHNFKRSPFSGGNPFSKK